MDYSKYFSILYHYKRKEIGREERSILFKVMNDADLSKQLSSYLKLRDKVPLHDLPLISKLLRSKLLVERKRRLLRGFRKYELASTGLFFILSETSTYAPNLLKKYSNDPILLTLLYQYFEVNTIASSTVRFYSIIAQYLRFCCRITLNWLEDTQNSNEEHKRKMMNDILFELELNAKLLAIRIVIMYSESNILAFTPKYKTGETDVAYYQLECRMKEILSKDKKFIDLLNKTDTEFKEVYKELDFS